MLEKVPGKVGRKKISTRFPVNLKDKDNFIFYRRKFYHYPHLEVKELNNVFLSHYGILLKNLFPVKYTLPNAFGFKKPNAGFIFKFYIKAIEIYFVTRFGKSLELLTLSSKKKYLFIYSPWFGYFSWVTESLPRIIKVMSIHDELTLLLPESYTKKSFVMQSIKMFPKLNYEVIKEGVHMKIPNITTNTQIFQICIRYFIKIQNIFTIN